MLSPLLWHSLQGQQELFKLMDLFSFLFFYTRGTGERIVIYWTLKTVNWNVIRATFPKWVHLFKTIIKRYTDPASSSFWICLEVMSGQFWAVAPPTPGKQATPLSCPGQWPKLTLPLMDYLVPSPFPFSLLTLLVASKAHVFSVERFAWGTLYLLSPKKWPLMQSVESHKWGW